MQDENLIPYVEGALGRWYPVTKSGASRPVLDRGPAPQDRARAVLGRHGAVRVHQELEIHHPQQRERVGEGGEPRGHRQVDAGEGGRRDGREDQSRSLAEQLEACRARSFFRGSSLPRKSFSTWQVWGLLLLAPYVLVFLVFVLYPVTLRPVARAQPGELPHAVRGPDLLHARSSTPSFSCWSPSISSSCSRSSSRASSCTSGAGSAGCR